jgi:hypothetical protein
MEELAGTATFHQTEPWSGPRSGTRTLYGPTGALAFAKQHGIEIQDDVRFVVEPAFIPSNAWAVYFRLKNLMNVRNFIQWTDFYTQGKIWVRIRPEVLMSDEAIVAVLGHEMHELNALRLLFARNNGVQRSQELYLLIDSAHGVLHHEAVAAGDALVLSLRRSRGLLP